MIHPQKCVSVIFLYGWFHSQFVRGSNIHPIAAHIFSLISWRRLTTPRNSAGRMASEAQRPLINLHRDQSAHGTGSNDLGGSSTVQSFHQVRGRTDEAHHYITEENDGDNDDDEGTSDIFS